MIMKLGMVTYLMAAEWTVEQIIDYCGRLGFEGVELRTTHRHGIEPALSAARRKEVRRRFADSPVALWGLGTTVEFHAVDPAEVERNIQEAGRFIDLAHEVGATGIKVRPNGLQTAKGIAENETLAQIARSFARVGEMGKQQGVEVWMEVHGPETAQPARIRKIMDQCESDNCFVCWNSNKTDMDENGSIDDNFALLAPWIRSCHINEIADPAYPYRRLFELLQSAGFGERFTLAEIQGTSDPERFLPYYRALWKELQPHA